MKYLGIVLACIVSAGIASADTYTCERSDGVIIIQGEPCSPGAGTIAHRAERVIAEAAATTVPYRLTATMHANPKFVSHDTKLWACRGPNCKKPEPDVLLPQQAEQPQQIANEQYLEGMADAAREIQGYPGETATIIRIEQTTVYSDGTTQTVIIIPAAE